MSDDIDALVDWQIANRTTFDVITHVCRVCLTSWRGEPTTCPECEVVQ